jgi:hypothetical protein
VENYRYLNSVIFKAVDNEELLDSAGYPPAAFSQVTRKHKSMMHSKTLCLLTFMGPLLAVKQILNRISFWRMTLIAKVS